MPERSLLGTISDLDRARPAPGFFHGRDALFSFADKALSAATQEKNMPFQPGVSGNPAGRPRGSRNKSSILLESMVEKDLEAIMQTVTTQAKEGNVAAARLCLSALGRRHGQPVTCDLAPLNTPATRRNEDHRGRCGRWRTHISRRHRPRQAGRAVHAGLCEPAL
jgi:Family of unknown function (DUF5681)